MNLSLLANTSAWKYMGDRFSGDHLQLQTEDVVGFAVIVILFGLGYFILQSLAVWQKKSKMPCPKDLFRELCEAHGLERRDGKVLTKIAQSLELADPIGLFVRPDLFERRCVYEAVGKETSRKLKQRLFD